MKLSSAVNSINEKTKLSICGYPAIKYERDQEDGPEKTCQWGITLNGRVLEVRKDRAELIHRVSSLHGQSGSPLIEVGEKDEPSIIGIHKGGVNTKINGSMCKANSGKLLTPELLEILKTGAKLMGAEPFIMKE